MYESYADPNIVYRENAKKILIIFGDSVVPSAVDTSDFPAKPVGFFQFSNNNERRFNKIFLKIFYFFIFFLNIYKSTLTLNTNRTVTHGQLLNFKNLKFKSASNSL